MIETDRTVDAQHEHLDDRIVFTHRIKQIGERKMNHSAFDTKKKEAYAAEAERLWGHTDAYREFADKSKGRAKETEEEIARGMMLIFADFGKIKETDPAAPDAQALVKRLQAYISGHYYRCTPEILGSLGAIYASDGAFAENIDKAGGEGTAAFAAQAISVYCRSC